MDAQTYHEQALDLVKGWTGVASPPPAEVFWQPPLYPYLLAGLYWLLGVSFWKVRLVQALMGSFTVVLASELASRAFNSRTAWLTGVLLAFYGPLLFYDGELLVPVLSLLLDTLALWVYAGAKKRSLGRLALTGFLLGLSAVARPTVLLFAGVLVGWEVFGKRRDFRGAQENVETSPSPFSRRLGRGLVLSLMLMLPILPVTLHNGRAAEAAGETGLDRLVLISSNGGVNFYLGNQEDYHGAVGIRPGIAWKALMREPARARVRGDAATSRYWTGKALNFLEHEPIAALKLYAQKAWLLVQSHELYRNLDYRFFAGLYAPWLLWLPSFGLLLPLAGLGLWRARRQAEMELHRVFQLYLLTQAIGIVMFFVVARYRLSLVPVLAIYAGFGLDAFWRQLQEARQAEPQASRRLMSDVVATALAILAAGGVLHLDPYQVAEIDRSEGYNLMGQAHSLAERHPQALEAFTEAIKLNPQNVDAVFNLGRELHLVGRCEEAIPYYSQALLHFPDDRDSLNNRALCLLATGQRKAGIAGLQALLTLYPASPDVLFNLAQAQEQDRDLNGALHSIQQARKLSPHEPMIAALEQSLTRAQGRITRVEQLLQDVDARIQTSKELRTALESSDRQAERQALDARLVALNNLGHQRLIGKSSGPDAVTKDGQPTTEPGSSELVGAEAALDPLLDALTLDAGYSTAWSNLAQSLFLMGRFEQAVQSFQVALKLKPDFHGARLGLAITYLRMSGHRAQAREALHQLVRESDGGLKSRAEQLLEEVGE